jgi:D-alanyl-D-alanine carboxypeptidase
MSKKENNNLIQHNAEVATAISLLDKWIAMTAHKGQQPGIAAGIVYEGELIWSNGYGYADLESKTPVTKDTLFRIASITKTFTATAIMQLRDSGKLQLDDPLSKHLPWFDLQYPGAQQITIRHALTHTSGLPRDGVNPQWTENDFQPWDEFVEATKKRKPVMPPVTEFKYSNLAYSLLGGVIESASGEKWENYIQTHILDPLEMNNTLVTPVGDEPGMATGYLRGNENHLRQSAPPVPSNAFSPSTSMASSVSDLVKYAHFHLGKGDKGILSIHSLRDMHRVHWLEKDWKSGYGLGLMLFRVNDWEISGHGGGYKGYLTGFTMCREHNLGVIILTNAINSDPMQYVERAYKLVLPEIIKAAKEKSEPNPGWQQYVGSYTADWGESEVVVRAGQLQIISLAFIDMPPTELQPTDTPHVFKIKQTGEGGETARFEFDDNGNIVKLWFNNEYSIPKK